MATGTSSQSGEVFPAARIQCHPNPAGVAGNCHELPLHLAIGMFDGVHIGHQAVIRQAVEAAAREQGHCAGVLTFNPHPSRVLYPKMATRMLMPLRSRIRGIHRAGADAVFVQEFTVDYAKQEAKSFLPSLLKDFPLLRSIHVGENFRFGSGRSGNIDTLRKSAHENGVELHALQRKVMAGMAISSSRIRAALMEGSISEVNGMLGEPYTISGRVIGGKGVGRTIGYPTLNVPWDPEVSPRFGVYLVDFWSADGDQAIRAIANYGLRPTMGESTDPLVEVHLLDNQRLPSIGDEVSVQLLQFIRPEKQFATMDALRDQIARDVQLARSTLGDAGIVS